MGAREAEPVAAASSGVRGPTGTARRDRTGGNPASAPFGFMKPRRDQRDAVAAAALASARQCGVADGRRASGARLRYIYIGDVIVAMTTRQLPGTTSSFNRNDVASVEAYARGSVEADGQLTRVDCVANTTLLTRRARFLGSTRKRKGGVHTRLPGNIASSPVGRAGGRCFLRDLLLQEIHEAAPHETHAEGCEEEVGHLGNHLRAGLSEHPTNFVRVR